jgi:hypothetical protein
MCAGAVDGARGEEVNSRRRHPRYQRRCRARGGARPSQGKSRSNLYKVMFSFSFLICKVLPNSPLLCFLSSICSPSYADPSWALPVDRCGGQGQSAQTLLPLTVKQTMDAAQASGDRSNFAINGVEVSTVRILPFFRALLRLRPHIGVQHVFLFFVFAKSLWNMISTLNYRGRPD